MNSRWWRRFLAMAGIVLALMASPPGMGAALTNTLVLQTGPGPVLRRITVPLVIPTNFTTASLRLDFSFGTDEPFISGEFLDSLTLTFMAVDRSPSVAVLTVDRFGVVLAPDNPFSLLDRSRDFIEGPGPVGAGTGGFRFAVHESLLVQVPAAFLAEPSVLIVTLFDNQDADASKAVVDSPAIHPGLGLQPGLESSASVLGPYARESGVVVDLLRQTATVPKAGLQRFYRLRGGTPSRVIRLGWNREDLVVDYDKEVGQPSLRLEGANKPDGPFVPVTNATLDLKTRRAVVPLLNAPGFFRVVGTHPARIINDVVTGEQRILDFEIAPVPPELLSSASATGPYALEAGVTAEPFARRLTLPDGGVMRFYRVVSGIPRRVRETVLNGDNMVIRYEDP